MPGWREAAFGGKKTLRIPCASHLSGKNEANTFIQTGKVLNWKKTPEVNCKTRTIGVTMAPADLADRGTLENAMPRRVQLAKPRTESHVNVSHA